MPDRGRGASPAPRPPAGDHVNWPSQDWFSPGGSRQRFYRGRAGSISSARCAAAVASARAAASFAACARRIDARCRNARVSIRNIAYTTPSIEVPVGSTVEWRNNDQMPHTVSATDKSFDVGQQLIGLPKASGYSKLKIVKRKS